MFYDDHNPPLFHAVYEGEQVLVDIRTLSVIFGKLSPRALGLVIEWATLHQIELMEDWDRARAMQALEKIAPLS